MFGNQATQGGGPFGGGVGNLQQTQNASLFGGNNSMANNQNQGSLFGTTTQNKPASFGGGGLFNGPQANTNTGLFGATQNPQSGGGLFGGGQIQQTQSNQNGLFGQNQTQTSSLFGQNQQQQPQQNGGLFTKPANTGLFGQSTQPTTGLFGANTSQMQQPANQGLFGAQNPQTFGQPSTGGVGGLFGGQNKPGGLFGTTQQPPVGGLLPSTTQNSLFQQPSTTNTWGATQQQPTSNWGAPQQQPTTFGQTQGFGQSTPGFGGNTNQLGGTSWGVNTSFNQPVVTQQQPISNQPPITPVKSKNPKVDNKHSVKCISALDQYTGMSK
jgi:nuclear pore complex protein Nup98-Nup96